MATNSATSTHTPEPTQSKTLSREEKVVLPYLLASGALPPRAYNPEINTVKTLNLDTEPISTEKSLAKTGPPQGPSPVVHKQGGGSAVD